MSEALKAACDREQSEDSGYLWAVRRSLTASDGAALLTADAALSATAASS